MAERPLFIPDFEGRDLFHEEVVEFKWSSGFAEIQKKKSIHAMHQVAFDKGFHKVLEISTKSDEEIGRRLSAFNLRYELNGRKYFLESIYQGSKVFKNCGPFPEIFDYTPRDAKKFIHSLNGGNLKEYNLGGKAYPLSPPNAFYDWLYIRSLREHADGINENVQYDAFTDIEFNPKKQINCQARAFASYLALIKKNKLSTATSSFEAFIDMHNYI